VVNDDAHIKFVVEKGHTNGDTIVIKGEGEQVPDLMRGDIIFVLNAQKHPRFRRVGNDLFMD